ncbi:MAG TPA: MFS transporter [Gemmatimonadales bacterium]|nr:MFS transporter [Gemmatimonadales bacterium]
MTWYRWYALGLLSVLNILNYVSRNILFALFEPIKRDLALTDTQLGWLASAYVLVFSIAVLPFGVVSDLRSRRAVVVGGVALWSTATVLSGLVEGFGQLFVCRAAVGIGGAAFLTAATSLAADYFPGKGRALAMGVLAAGLALGGGLAYWLGGHLEVIYGWRAALMAVGLPGFAGAVLAARLAEPVRPPAAMPLREYLRSLGVGASAVLSQCIPLAVGVAIGTVAAVVLDRVYGATSKADVAALGAAVGIGLALNIRSWVKQSRAAARAGKLVPVQSGESYVPAMLGTAAGGPGPLGDLMRAAQAVLRTPTLVYVFIAGALVSFGLNGLLAWAPSLVARVFGLTAGAFADLLGVPGLAAGILGSIAGGLLADWMRRYTDRGRALTVSIGLLIGGPLALWLLGIRDLDVFVPVFCAAFFFLTWFNGPITAVIFDVVPARISATVVGAYLLFIHLAGDTISFPLIGALSDRFGIERAVFLLPAVAVVGGILMLAAARTVGSDMRRARAQEEATSGRVLRPSPPSSSAA